MSRLYSQRNRDKQKRITQELSYKKTELDRENASLRKIQQEYTLKLQAARVENEALKRRQQSNQAASTASSAIVESAVNWAASNQPSSLLQLSYHQRQYQQKPASLDHETMLLELAASLRKKPQQQQQQTPPPSVAGILPALFRQHQPPVRGSSGIIQPLHQEITTLDTTGGGGSGSGSQRQHQRLLSSVTTGIYGDFATVEKRRRDPLNINTQNLSAAILAAVAGNNNASAFTGAAPTTPTPAFLPANSSIHQMLQVGNGRVPVSQDNDGQWRIDDRQQSQGDGGKNRARRGGH